MEFHVLLSFPKQQATRLCLDFLPFIAWIQNCQYWQLLWAVFNFTVGNTVTKLPRQPLGSYPSWKLQSYFWGGGRESPQWARTSSFTRFLDHTQRRNTVGRTPLDEVSARRRDIYVTPHNTHNRQHPYPRWDRKPQSQQASGRRPTPQTARPLGSAVRLEACKYTRIKKRKERITKCRSGPAMILVKINQN